MLVICSYSSSVCDDRARRGPTSFGVGVNYASDKKSEIWGPAQRSTVHSNMRGSFAFGSVGTMADVCMSGGQRREQYFPPKIIKIW